jgi:uncharacterized protein
VIDQTGTLTPTSAQALESKLAAFEAGRPADRAAAGQQHAPEDIAAYAQRVADSWKIGRRDVGDGVLLVVSKGDRRVRIEVAKALEGAIPDLAARQIIDNAVRPAFRADDYAGGLNAAVDQIHGTHQGRRPARARVTRRRRAARPAVGGAGHVLLRRRAHHRLGADGHLRARLGSLLTAGAAGGAGWWYDQHADGRLGAGHRGAAARRAVRHRRGRPARRPQRRRPAAHRRLGRWRRWRWRCGGGGGGGFSSGGGGDFGGGGASGDW